MKIKNRLLLLLIPAIVVALCLLTFFSYWEARQQAETAAFSQAQSIALEQSARTLDKLRQAESAVLSFSPIVLEMKKAEAGRELVKFALRGLGESSKDFFGVCLLW